MKKHTRTHQCTQSSQLHRCNVRYKSFLCDVWLSFVYRKCTEWEQHGFCQRNSLWGMVCCHSCAPIMQFKSISRVWKKKMCLILLTFKKKMHVKMDKLPDFFFTSVCILSQSERWTQSVLYSTPIAMNHGTRKLHPATTQPTIPQQPPPSTGLSES